MPFKSITTFSDDPLVKLAREYEYFQRRDKRMAELEELRRQQLYGLELPSGLGIDSDRVPDPYEVSPIERLNQAKIAQRTRKNRLQAPLDDVSMDMLSHPDEYLLRDPAKRAQMARDVGGKMSGALSLMSLPMSFVAPAAMGTGLLAKGLTGAGLNVALSAPSYMHDPDTAEPLLDALMGAGAGVAGLPGAIVGGLMGWSPDIEAGYASGGAVKSLGKRMAKYFAEDSEPLSKVQDIVKEVGGNWLPGSLESTFSGLKKEGDLQHSDEVLNKWIEGPLTKYVRRDMATLEDPIRVLAEQGILHYTPQLPRGFTSGIGEIRTKRGFPAKGVAKSRLAKDWEKASDQLIMSTPAKTLLSGLLQDNVMASNPWLTKIDPDSPVYDLIPSRATGFDHLTDELRNALNPESGLPRNLLLNPADMQQMGIDRAVRHVAKINDWRAKEMERTALADMTGIPVVKEYPEGYKWVELKKPENVDTSGYSVRKSSRQPPAGEPIWELVDPAGKVVSNVSGDEEFAKQMIGEHLSSSQLQKWLKQEGDAMGHCVGGYCDDVAEGRSRILSLRDNKGSPHVTIEVSPGVDLTRGLMSTSPSFRNRVAKELGFESFNKMPSTGTNMRAAEEKAKELAKGTQRIVQIKGKQNKAPNPEYLPFVQDFVKSQGPWSEVVDFRNAGLYNPREVGRGMAHGQELIKRLLEKNPDMTPDQFDQLKTKLIDVEGYLTLDEMIEHLTRGQGYASGGVVKSLGRRMAKYFAEDPEHLSKVQEIIKETGGNWLGGRVEKSLASLKLDRSQIGIRQKEIYERMQQPGFDEWVAEQAQKFPGFMNRYRDLQGQLRDQALDKFTEGPLTKYVKRDLATPKDPVRALAEQGILHYAPELEVSPYLLQMRANQGFPSQGVGKSQLARAWEAMSDRGIHSGKARAYQNDIRDLNENPWLEKLAPHDPVYFPIGGSSFPVNLGLDHLTDELRNALNPESGLPRELLLNVDDMKQMGIDRAVRHVDKINKYRAKEMERAALADMAGLPVVKEYPEGFKWVELTDPEAKSITESEAMQRISDELKKEGIREGTRAWDREFEARVEDLMDSYGENAPKSSERLAKWLKQEGDIMGHCVGGYCNDVLSGRSRIFSLRDLKGQPHVTIEVRPGSYASMDPDNPQVQSWIKERAKQYEAEYGQGAHDAAMEDYMQEQPFANMADWVAQIKGKQDRAPKPEYLPFVQDFVRTQGPWSGVDDLQNTGLRPSKHIFNDLERQTLIGQGAEIGEYLTPDEVKQIRKLWPTSGFAVGGQVKSPEVLKIIAEFGGKYAAS